MVRSALLATALLASFCASSAQGQSFSSGETVFTETFSGYGITSAQAQTYAAEEMSSQADNKLLIVDRDRGRVIYDGGGNDLFCATQQVFVGYNYYGRPVYRRTMKCR